MNPEAIKWLEAQPINFGAAILYYEMIEEQYGPEIDDRGYADMMPIIQTKFFDIKNDHELATQGTDRCFNCRYASNLLVVGDDDG